ncbi:hypothetical protein HWV62_16092 [Athelia sp. TMB]|nr:hypothetical protein HWV62_16092 [Athelia sp. TMB]
MSRPMTPFGEIPSVDELDDWQLEEEVEGRERNGQSGTDPSLQTELHNFSTWSSRDKSLESTNLNPVEKFQRTFAPNFQGFHAMVVMAFELASGSASTTSPSPSENGACTSWHSFLSGMFPQDDVLLEQEYTLHEVHGVVVLLVASSISVVAVLGLLLAIFALKGST